MTKLTIGGGNLPAKKPGALTIGAKTTPATTSDAPQSGALSTQIQKAQDRAAFRQKPFLVYLMVDMTGSRNQTRDVMRPHEQSLAHLIMNSGGNHPVVVKGIHHYDSHASAPIDLKSEGDILKFLSKSPVVGATNIYGALQSYANDQTKDVLSLGVLVGDAYDGDDGASLVALAGKLKEQRRPIIVAHQETGQDDFCSNVGPAIATASGGLDFSLGTQPEELHALLANYKKILTATPDELKATASDQKTGGIVLSGSGDTQRFARAQAQTLLLTFDKS